MHSPAKKCAASRHVIIYSLQLTKSNRIKVTQIMKCLVFLNSSLVRDRARALDQKLAK